MSTTPTLKNYADTIQIGPYDVYYLQAVTPAVPFATDRLVIDPTSLTPDSTTYTGAVCLGFTLKESDIKLMTKTMDIGADQLTAPFSAYVEQESGEIDLTTRQYEQLKLQLLMSGTTLFSTTSGAFAGNSAGGINEPTFGAYACIAPVRGKESTDAQVVLFYRAMVEPSISTKFGRKAASDLPWKIKAYSDFTRAAGKQLWNQYHLTSLSGAVL